MTSDPPTDGFAAANFFFTFQRSAFQFFHRTVAVTAFWNESFGTNEYKK
jgi:hypothetical protein